MTARTISLRAGQAIPAGEPSRYLNASGYVRLRWLVSPNTYKRWVKRGTVTAPKRARFA